MYPDYKRNPLIYDWNKDLIDELAWFNGCYWKCLLTSNIRHSQHILQDISFLRLSNVNRMHWWYRYHIQEAGWPLQSHFHVRNIAGCKTYRKCEISIVLRKPFKNLWVVLHQNQTIWGFSYLLIWMNRYNHLSYNYQEQIKHKYREKCLYTIPFNGRGIPCSKRKYTLS